jgi:DNA cross-link repair 1C protein
VNSLIRHPILIPYTLGQKRLDKLYLDSTFATATSPFREFPSKAEGLAELLQKVQAYSDDTVFYFRAWTFGYEDVWVALSAALNTKVISLSYPSHALLADDGLRFMWIVIKWAFIGL